MATTAQQSEILRKAKAGIALTNPTQASSALYNSYKQPAAKQVTQTSRPAGTPATAQAWINDPHSGFGGMDNYKSMQQEKMNNAVQNHDDAARVKLLQDMQRVGYSLTSPSVQSAASPETQSTTPNGSDLINGMYNNNLASQMQALRKARDTQLQGLNGQETVANQNAYSNRNSADALALMNLKRVQEQNAANGINGGDSVTATLSNNTDRQNAANSINQDQANRLSDIAQQRSAISNASSADELSLIQQLQAARDQMSLGQLNADRSFGLQQGGLTGNYNGSRTLAGQQFDYGQQTDQRNYDYQQARDKIADTQYKQKFDEDVRQFGMTYAADQAVKNRQMSQEDARIAVQRSQESRLSSGGSGGSGGSPKPAHYSYKTDPEFSKEISYINSNPAGALAEIQKNAQALSNAYGYDGYLELVKQATPKK